MRRSFYDSENRVFTLLGAAQRGSVERRFRVRFQRGKSRPADRLAFPDSQPITLYTTSKRVRVMGVVCVRAVRLVSNNRVADVTVDVLDSARWGV